MVYKTKGVCSQSIDVEVENGIVKHVQFTGGCNGNTQGVSRLIEGMDANVWKAFAAACVPPPARISWLRP